MSTPERARFGWAVLLLVSLAARLTAQPVPENARSLLAASGRVGESVITALDSAPTARVLVAFALPGELARADSTDGIAARPVAIQRTVDSILATLASDAFEIGRRFQSINAIGGVATLDGLQDLISNPAVLRVDLEERLDVQISNGVELMRLQVLNAQGFTGDGVTVAIIDTGYDSDHPDLSDDLVGERCFCTGGCCPDLTSDQSGPGSAEDDGDHGTEMAGVITARGLVAGPGGAPDAGIVAIKTFNSANQAFASDILAGLDWVAVERPDVRLVNMSFATQDLFDAECDDENAFGIALSAVVEVLAENGTTAFASSGNNSSSTQMPMPACIHRVISVGGVASTEYFGFLPDELYSFSNGNAETDVVAPAGPTITTGVGGGTALAGSTSIACAAAVSCAAALLEYEPSLSPEQLELALESSSTRVPDPRNGLDYPRVDCVEAVEYIEANRPQPPPVPVPVLSNPARVLACLALLAVAFVALRFVPWLRRHPLA